MSDWWTTVALIGSVILNVVLGVLFFIKPALVQIAPHWYQERLRRRNAYREMLLELNARMSSYTTSYLMLLVNVGIGPGPADQSPSSGEAGEEMQSTNAFLDRHEPELPERLRKLIVELRKAIRVPASAVRNRLSRDELSTRIRAVREISEQIQAEVRRLVR
jgi:uncharacterized coiled-coil DUF342 family protein